MKMRQDFEAGVRNLRKFKSALIFSFIYLFVLFCFVFERKICFISDTSIQGWGRLVDICPKTNSSLPDKQCGKKLYKQKWGAAACRNSTVISNILKLIICGLISIILVVLGTVNLQFQGSIFPISLWLLLRIVAAHVGTVWSSCS